LLEDRAAFQAALAVWFGRCQRALPWRTERSLYRTVVSEFMLQQTQVKTVVPFFGRWMAALPDFAALAAAEEAVVLKLWEGLGYYRRARFLHRLARELAARGGPPRTAEAWMELPGVGPYTAAAIASLAFDDPVAVVDGNVVRILARLTGWTRGFADGSSAVAAFTGLAGALLDAGHPGRHNEAMMELGATVCLPRQPACAQCPVRAWCAGHRSGRAAALPRIGRPATASREVDRVWVRREGCLLMHRMAGEAARMGGLCELPTAEHAGVKAEALRGGRLLATHRRAITRYRVTERIYRVEPPSGGVGSGSDTSLVWVPVDGLGAVAMSGPHRRWVAALLAQERQARQGGS
jgi:A/G-specific adenine glycosylase